MRQVRVYGDYSWSGTVIQQKNKDGWAVVDESKFVDLTRPWTWIKAPVTSITFVQTGNVIRANAPFVIAPVLLENYDFSQTSDDQYVMAINCKMHQWGRVSDPQNINFNKIDFSDVPLLSQIEALVCKK